jgi:Pyruvate/2-oxoacid:ferredoxin oxidoreductase delta subunit
LIFAQGTYLEVCAARCLNQRHNGVKCGHCIGHCPSGALVYRDGSLELDKRLCSGCGLCISDCPTAVFRSSQWDESSISNDIAEAGWQVTEVFCARHPQPGKKDKDRKRGALRLPACLVIVSQGGWYEMGLLTALELHLEMCGTCPLNTTAERLHYHIDVAVEWLKASGCDPAFAFIHESDSVGWARSSRQTVDTGMKVTSRRDLFVSLLDHGRRLTGQSATASKPELKSYNDCLPNWQRRLADVYRVNQNVEAAAGGGPDVAPAYWPTIRINDDCVNCGMCSRYCPSETLRLTLAEGVCTHSFTGGLCLDCRICQLFCPQEAISRDREPNGLPFVATDIRHVAVTRCRICGSVTRDCSHSLCYWCEEAADNDGALKNSLKALWGENE